MHIVGTTGVTRPDGRILDNVEDGAYGAGISLIFEDTDVEASGPRLHQHLYAEAFIIHAGRALFTVDGEELVGEAGQILVVPENTPRKFAVLGPGRYVATHIHATKSSSPSGSRTNRPCVARVDPVLRGMHHLCQPSPNR